jgi:hypothetical protein
MRIVIQAPIETAGLFKMTATVDGHTFSVTVSRMDWKRLTDEKETPKELVRRSFLFLLEREPVGQILSTFNLIDIQKYFPEYEKMISRSDRADE